MCLCAWQVWCPGLQWCHLMWSSLAYRPTVGRTLSTEACGIALSRVTIMKEPKFSSEAFGSLFYDQYLLMRSCLLDMNFLYHFVHKTMWCIYKNIIETVDRLLKLFIFYHVERLLYLKIFPPWESNFAI